MNWKWLNPWRELREAREKIAVLEDRCSEYRERADDAERRAFGYASDHYHQRLRMEEQKSAHAMQKYVELASPTPINPAILPDWLLRENDQEPKPAKQ